MSDKVEIEIKLPLENGEELSKKLNDIAKFRSESRQVDRYFDAPHRSFVKNVVRVDEWLRLREDSHGNYSLTYKNFHPKGDVPKTHCDEYETQFSSMDDFELFFKAMNFSLLVEVDKLRRVWDFEDYEISIDDVKDLGKYIEVEYKGKSKDIEAVRIELFDVLKKIGAKTGELDKRGYPYELMIKKGLLER